MLALAGGMWVFPTFAGEATRNVLVIFSNSRLLPANVEVDRGIREALSGAPGPPIGLFAEFLDQPVFHGEVFEQTLATYLRTKYADHPPTVIICAGGESLDFVIRFRSQLFPGAPVFHVSIDRDWLSAHGPFPPDIVGVPIEHDASGSIRLAMQWHPRVKRLVIVTGASTWDRDWETHIRGTLPRLQPGQNVEYLSGWSTPEILKRLGELGKDDMVFTPGYFTDGDGRQFAPRDAATLMTSGSGAPIYAPFDTFIGTGVVGGLMTTYLEMGRQVGGDVRALLSGTSLADLRMPAKIPSQVQIDARAAKKWGLALDRLPSGAIVHFRQPTLWEAYRSRAIAVLGLVLLQAALIAALLIERRSRRRVAAALAQSEQRMSLAARAARLSMWVWDVARDRFWATGRVEFPGAGDDAPVPLESVLDSVHPADRERFEHAVRQSIAKDEELDVEYRVSEPNGVTRWIAARGRAENTTSRWVRGVALDITARKEAELQAERDRAALTHLSRVSMMGQLSASIAHQLNQPLAAILGNAETARKMLDHEDLDLVELRSICDDIITEDIRAAEVIRRLGALYKRGEMTITPVDLNDLVAETLDLLRTELMNRQVVAVTELALSLPAIDAGRVHLQQVLLNLILNAADAMGKFEPAERRLVIQTKIEDQKVSIRVIDRGMGMQPGDIGSVFDAFWSTKEGGMGIGLAICLSIVKAHRGSIVAANNGERGATFTVTLPLRQMP